MMYCVTDDIGDHIYFGQSLAEAEERARHVCDENYPTHLFVLKETYETITAKRVEVIKQGERLERHSK